MSASPDPRQEGAPQARRAATWRRYLHFWGPRAAADVDDELQFHIDMRVRDYMARGMPEREARAAAGRRLGDVAAVRAACVATSARRERRTERARLLDALAQDLRFAFRTLARQKGWTAIAVLTLALGIGANTAVFSAVDNLLLHPLPYPDASRIVLLYQEPSRGNRTGIEISVVPQPKVLKAWREQSRSFEDIEAFTTTDRILRPRDGAPTLVHTASVLPTFARFAGARPLVGRMFDRGDVASAARVALLSEGAWRSRYGSDPRVVGRTMDLDGQPYTIIGVLPASLRLPRLGQSPADVWLPLDLAHDGGFSTAIGRLRPGVTLAAAQRELDGIALRVEGGIEATSRFSTRLMSPSRLVSFRQSLVLLAGAVALVLLVACANVAHLLLARAATRQREMAIRAAIGAGRGRLLRQLLTESTVLALAGCAGGLVVGWLALRVLVALRPASLDELSAAHMNGATLLVTIALSLLTGIAFGLAGALHSARWSTHETLKAGALSASHTRRQGRARSLLVVSEIALSTTLLVGATLLVRSVRHLQSTDPGFDPAGLYAVAVELPHDSSASAAARAEFFRELAGRARRLPGVSGVTVVGTPPPSRSFLIGALQVEGEDPPPAGTTSFIDYEGVQPDYFRVMRIPVLAGGTFTDTSDASTQVLVNEGFARKYWPGGTAIGHRLRVAYDGQGEWKTIIGVVKNAFTGGLAQSAGDPKIYLPEGAAQHSTLLVRTTAGDRALPILRSLVRSLDPSLPSPDVTSIQSAMRDSIAGVRFTMLLLGVFTLLAVVLAAVGLYGVMSYGVARRTREIGIRVALGATRRDVARSVVAEGLALAAIGVILGLVGAYWATALLERMLYGIPRGDPASYAAGAALLLCTAAAACIVPMRRAVAVDPLIAMRAE